MTATEIQEAGIRRSKVNATLKILDRECGEAKEQLLADICDLCHHPHVLSQEQLDEKCSKCTILWDLEGLLKKQRAVTTGRTMAIVAEEMLGTKEGTT